MIPPEFVTALSALLGAVGGILGTWAVARKSAREDAQTLIDLSQPSLSSPPHTFAVKVLQQPIESARCASVATMHSIHFDTGTMGEEV